MRSSFDKHLSTLKPKRARIVFMLPAVCNGFWLDPESNGCGHVVRAHYMENPKALATAAVCPICGERYVFAFYKLKADRDYQPTPEEDADIRAFWLTGKRIVQGKQEPGETVSLAERVRIHCRQVGCAVDGHPTDALTHQSYSGGTT